MTYTVGDDESISKYECSIREAYYNKDGEVISITSNASRVASDDGLVDITKILKMMMLATDKPVIDLETFVFAEYK
jgi:hypothetical protein